MEAAAARVAALPLAGTLLTPGPNADRLRDPVAGLLTGGGAPAGIAGRSFTELTVHRVRAGKNDGEPGTGATAFRLAPTSGDGPGLFAQAGGSPSDSNRPMPTYRIRMACRGLGFESP
jgi:hypothetical protein